jgi:hypothetical protein
VDAYPCELRERSALIGHADVREVVQGDANGVRVFSKDCAVWQCIRYEGGGFTEITGASASAVLAVHRRHSGLAQATWHVDLAKRAVHDLRAMGVTQIHGGLSCGHMLALSRDRAQIDLVDLDRGAIVATLQLGPHTLVSMDVDAVFILRNGALARIDVREHSVTDMGEQTAEEAAPIPPIASVLVTDRAELVTVNAAGRRCAYDHDGALVAESNEPLASEERVCFVGASDGDRFVFEQKTLASRTTVVTKRSLAGRDILQEVARLELDRWTVVHGCTAQGRVLFSYDSSAHGLSLSGADLSQSDRLVGAAGRVRACRLGPTDERARLQCHEPDLEHDADGNLTGRRHPSSCCTSRGATLARAQCPGRFPFRERSTRRVPSRCSKGRLASDF